MNKIGIITLTGYYNYGNRLQNYATCEVIKSLGYKPETIKNYPIYKKINNKIIFGLRDQIIKPIYLKFKNIKNPSNYELLEKKIENFKKFSEEHLNESRYAIYMDDTKDLNEKDYYKFVTGSDQVWNPYFTSGGDQNTFLTFAPSKKRIAIAPSFGVSTLEDKYKKNYKKWILDMGHLSCREEAGAQIIEELTNRKAQVIVDPTMMLKPEEWKRFSSPQKNKTTAKYLLSYFVVQPSEESKNKMKEIALKYNLEIINLNDKSHSESYIADPKEWVDYIENSTLFCTDSFHGIVFSIMMQTPFVVFDRGGNVKMNSRIDTILSKFNFENRKIKKLLEKEEYMDIDFDHCTKILKEGREKSINYLKNALEK